MAAEYVPEVIIQDVFSRLPIKCLIRFRCLSRFWNQLFTSWPSYFSHKRHSIHDHSHNSILIISNKRKRKRKFSDEEEQTKLYSMSVDSKTDKFQPVVEITSPMLQGKSFEIKTASCNGMVCLVIADSINTLVLFNPSTRAFKVLPPPLYSDNPSGVCGLGYDSRMDDYKIVNQFNYRVQVFSVKQNHWKDLGYVPYYLHQKGVPLNGCLYWLAAGTKDDLSRDRIICLDLSTKFETFRNVSLPRGKSRVPNFPILIRNGLLCLFNPPSRSLWLMAEEKKDDSVTDIWTELGVTPLPRPTTENRTYGYLSPKCFTDSGKLLVQGERWCNKSCINNDRGDSAQGERMRTNKVIKFFGFFLYDEEKQEPYSEDGKLEVDSIIGSDYVEAIAYTESLNFPDKIRGMNDID